MFCYYIIVLFILNDIKCMTTQKNVKPLDHPCMRDCSHSNTAMSCVYDWTIEWYSTMSKACFDCPFNKTDCDRAHCIPANGVERAVIVINRMLPGPSIQVCENDEIVVNVFNNLRLSESTSIHWHGMLQKGTPFMDGVAMITQCPISPHTKFQYVYKASNPGTHFWHSHSGLQRVDGAFGSLIIRQNKRDDIHFDKYDEDLFDHVIIINDWYDETVATQFNLYVHHNKTANPPNSILINGKGSRTTFTDSDGLHTTAKSMFKVEKGKRYRFRLISAGIAACALQFSIEKHNITLIASDGHPIEPLYDLEALVLYPGERFDIVVNADQAIGNYLIRVKGFGACGYSKLMETAILNYNSIDLPKENDIQLKVNYVDISIHGKQFNNFEIKNPGGINDSVLSFSNVNGSVNELYNKEIQGKPDKQFYFELEYKILNNPEFNHQAVYPIFSAHLDSQLYTPQINNISMHMPEYPPLTQWNDLSKEEFCNQDSRLSKCDKKDYCSCIHLIEVNLGDLVELVLVDASYTKLPIRLENKHPMHLHGYSFAVVGLHEFNSSEKITVPLVKELDAKGLIKRNLINPPFKDTLAMSHGGYAILRFRANNPGIWLYHCHVELHAEIGMTLILKVGKTSEFAKIPNQWPKCGSYLYKDVNNSPKFSAYSNDSIINKKFLCNIFLILFILLKLQ